MSLDVPQKDDRPLTSVDELVQFFQKAERPSGGLVGLEHEKLIVPAGGSRAAPFDGGIEPLLKAFAAHGFVEHLEGGRVIAMVNGPTTLTLEPGGQFELSGAPFRTAREAHAENVAHQEQLKEACRALGLTAVYLGYRPYDALEEMPWMPKLRYRPMRVTLGARGRLAHHMMLMTATGQVSLDWRDEADCARKVLAAARTAPLLVALYANSPLKDGAPAGYQSFRSRVWSEVDPARCGYPPCLVDGAFSYRRYVEWAIDAPLLFLRRGGDYLQPGLTFRELLSRGWEGQPARQSDWVDHLSTLFPEVRVKKVIELRSADACDVPMTGALAALFRGLLYDETALDEAIGLVPWRGLEAHLALHAAAQVEGLEARFDGLDVAALARELVAIARRGLERLDPLDVPVLAPLEEVARRGTSPARRVLEAHAQGLAPAALLRRFGVP